MRRPTARDVRRLGLGLVLGALGGWLAGLLVPHPPLLREEPPR